MWSEPNGSVSVEYEVISEPERLADREHTIDIPFHTPVYCYYQLRCTALRCAALRCAALRCTAL
jgi:hypothetical protein